MPARKLMFLGIHLHVATLKIIRPLTFLLQKYKYTRHQNISIILEIEGVKARDNLFKKEKLTL